MSKTLTIVIFAVFFIIMILDLVFGLPNILRGIIYGGGFLVGGFIYFSEHSVSDLLKTSDKENENGNGVS